MKKEITAALKAANAYKVRNVGDEPHHGLIVALLTDALLRVDALEGHADAYDRAQRIAAAQDELRAAEAGLTPDTLLKP